MKEGAEKETNLLFKRFFLLKNFLSAYKLYNAMRCFKCTMQFQFSLVIIVLYFLIF